MRYKLYSMGQLPVLKINKIGYSDDVKDTAFGPKKRDYYIICYVLSGKGFYNNTVLGEGEGFLVTPDITEHIYPDKDEPWEILWFISVDPKMQELFEYYNADRNFIFRHSCPVELFEIKELAIAENRKTINDAKMLELFMSVFKHHLNTDSDFSADKTAPQKYIDFSVNYIKTNFGQDLTVSKLTRLLGISQPYLYKIFKEAFGKSPKGYITDYRMNVAKEMLAETDFTVAEIAYKTGFSDSFAFSKCFSARAGMSPTDYRNMQKNISREVMDDIALLK